MTDRAPRTRRARAGEVGERTRGDQREGEKAPRTRPHPPQVSRESETKEECCWLDSDTTPGDRAIHLSLADRYMHAPAP